MTIKQLVGSLRNKAFVLGTDEALDNPSRTKLDRHDSEARAAEQAVIDRMESVERERDLLRRQVSEKERQVDVLISGMCDALLGRRSCRRCACKTGTDEECKSGLREWSLEQAKATAKEGG